MLIWLTAIQEFEKNARGKRAFFNLGVAHAKVRSALALMQICLTSWIQISQGWRQSDSYHVFWRNHQRRSSVQCRLLEPVKLLCIRVGEFALSKRGRIFVQGSMQASRKAIRGCYWGLWTSNQNIWEESQAMQDSHFGTSLILVSHSFIL